MIFRPVLLRFGKIHRAHFSSEASVVYRGNKYISSSENLYSLFNAISIYPVYPLASEHRNEVINGDPITY